LREKFGRFCKGVYSKAILGKERGDAIFSPLIWKVGTEEGREIEQPKVPKGLKREGEGDWGRQRATPT